MKLNFSDKVLLTLGCINTCSLLFIYIEILPAWKIVVQILAVIGFMYSGSKLWRTEEKK